MSSPYVLYDNNGDEFHLNKNYVRYGNRILDASFIASITVKKHKLLFNNFKQNTSLPTMCIPFKKDTDARHALNKCLEYYDVCSSNGLYEENDERTEVFLVDAYGGVMHVHPDYLKYRDRVLSVGNVQTLQVKGRRVLVNHFKGNMSVPTMCVHFADKDAAAHALNMIHSVLWNIPLEDAALCESVDADEELEGIPQCMTSSADPVFLKFMILGTSLLFALMLVRAFVGPDGLNDEL